MESDVCSFCSMLFSALPLWSQLRHVNLHGTLDDVSAALRLLPAVDDLRVNLMRCYVDHIEQAPGAALRAAPVFARIRRLRLRVCETDINVATLLSENAVLESLRLLCEYSEYESDIYRDVKPDYRTLVRDYTALLGRLSRLRQLRIKYSTMDGGSGYDDFTPMHWLKTVAKSCHRLSLVRHVCDVLVWSCSHC